MIELNTPVEQVKKEDKSESEAVVAKTTNMLTKKRAVIIRASLGINPGIMRDELDEIKS